MVLLENIGTQTACGAYLILTQIDLHLLGDNFFIANFRRNISPETHAQKYQQNSDRSKTCSFQVCLFITGRCRPYLDFAKRSLSRTGTTLTERNKCRGAKLWDLDLNHEAQFITTKWAPKRNLRTLSANQTWQRKIPYEWRCY